MIFLHKFNLKNLNIPSRISNKSRPFAMSLNRHVCPLSLALFYEHEGKFPCRIRDERKTAKKMNFNAKQEGIWRAKKKEKSQAHLDMGHWKVQVEKNSPGSILRCMWLSCINWILENWLTILLRQLQISELINVRCHF